MVYYPDLTAEHDTRIRVGWLDKDHSFPQGQADQRFIAGFLAILYSHRVRQTRGFHLCPFCKEQRFGILVELNERTLTLGSAEIEIRDRDNIYVAPDLIYHYIVGHQYLPPSAFVEAVFRAAERKLPPEV